jgi:hypothetical protein
VPLWQVFEGPYRDGVPFRLTMSLTPTLCAMLNDELLRERYLDRAIALSKREIDRTQSQPEINYLARIYHSRFSNAARSTSRSKAPVEYNRRLLAAWGQLSVELCRNPDSQFSVNEVPTALDKSCRLLVTPVDPDSMELRLEPWPFSKPRVELTCEGHVGCDYFFNMSKRPHGRSDVLTA